MGPTRSLSNKVKPTCDVPETRHTLLLNTILHLIFRTTILHGLPETQLRSLSSCVSNRFTLTISSSFSRCLLTLTTQGPSFAVSLRPTESFFLSLLIPLSFLVWKDPVRQSFHFSGSTLHFNVFFCSVVQTLLFGVCWM